MIPIEVVKESQRKHMAPLFDAMGMESNLVCGVYIRAKHRLCASGLDAGNKRTGIAKRHGLYRAFERVSFS